MYWISDYVYLTFVRVKCEFNILLFHLWTFGGKRKPPVKPVRIQACIKYCVYSEVSLELIDRSTFK